MMPVFRVLVYGSETWAMGYECGETWLGWGRAERLMVRRMCGVSLKDRKR